MPRIGTLNRHEYFKNQDLTKPNSCPIREFVTIINQDFDFQKKTPSLKKETGCLVTKFYAYFNSNSAFLTLSESPPTMASNEPFSAMY